MCWLYNFTCLDIHISDVIISNMKIEKIVERKDNKHSVIENVVIAFIKPKVAVELGVGNLFNSKDLGDLYPVAFATDVNGKLVYSAIVGVDHYLYTKDEQYKNAKLNEAKILFETYRSKNNIV